MVKNLATYLYAQVMQHMRECIVKKNVAPIYVNQLHVRVRIKARMERSQYNRSLTMITDGDAH